MAEYKKNLGIIIKKAVFSLAMLTKKKVAEKTKRRIGEEKNVAKNTVVIIDKETSRNKKKEVASWSVIRIMAKIWIGKLSLEIKDLVVIEIEKKI